MFGSLLQRAPGALLASVCTSGLCSTPIFCLAQEEAGTGPSISVLQTGTRLVIEDVLVVDGKGEPVHGLPKTAFHVFNEGRAQNIRNFEEGSPGKAGGDAPPALPPGVFSNNSYLYSSPLVSDIILIDADAVQIEN